MSRRKKPKLKLTSEAEVLTRLGDWWNWAYGGGNPFR